jgi:hypothetical protein
MEGGRQEGIGDGNGREGEEWQRNGKGNRNRQQ